MKKGRTRKTAIVIVVTVIPILLVVVVGGHSFILHKKLLLLAQLQSTTPRHVIPSTPNKPANVPLDFNKQANSLTDPNSIWVVVNKTHPLNPTGFAPNDLVVPNVPVRANITSDERQVSAKMATALEAMIVTAKQQGMNLNLQSGYRSYNFQVSLYNGYVGQEGQATADTQSARPGYSEHQTGLAADLGGTSQPACDVAQCFGNTVEGKWLAANAYQFGFIIRYPADKQQITGYEYEPWHIRYVGTPLATEMHNDRIETLEEFFNLGPAPDY